MKIKREIIEIKNHKATDVIVFMRLVDKYKLNSVILPKPDYIRCHVSGKKSNVNKLRKKLKKWYNNF